MNDNKYIIAAIFTSAAITFALRIFPFVLMRLANKYEQLFAFLGRNMPPTMMVILAIFALTQLRFGSLAESLLSLLAIAVVILLEHLKRQAIISIFVGLAIYVGGQSYLLTLS